MECEPAQQTGSGERVIHRTRYDAESEDPTTSVLLALDQIPGCDITAPEFVAFEHVDPDALDALFRGEADESSHVSFPIDDYQVTITADGEITVWSN